MRTGLISKLARGEGPFWRRAKLLIKGALWFHIPVNGLTKPIFLCLYMAHVGFRESGLWLCRFLWNEPLFRSQCTRVGGYFQMEQLPYLAGSGSIIVSDHVRLSGKSSFIFNNRQPERPELVIGSGTFIGHQCSFRVARSLRIGQHCLIAGGVMIADYDGHSTDAAKRRTTSADAGQDVRPVEIGDDVWIGAGATILKGVQIGSRAIVGAQSVVTRDVPPDTIVAGNPAVVVKRLPLDHPGIESATGGHVLLQAVIKESAV